MTLIRDSCSSSTLVDRYFYFYLMYFLFNVLINFTLMYHLLILLSQVPLNEYNFSNNKIANVQTQVQGIFQKFNNSKNCNFNYIDGLSKQP